MKLTDKFKLTDAERDQRMAFLHLTHTDFKLLAAMRKDVEKHIPAIVTEFYRDLLGYSEPRRQFADKKKMERVQAAQRDYLLSLFAGEPDDEYIEQRLRIGEIHERIGVPLKWYIGSMGWFFARIVAAMPPAGRTPEAVVALNKVMNLDLQLALESYASLSSRLKAMDQRIKDTASALNAVLDQDAQR
jgi:rsbT co-antagonist protein RsbR